MFASLYRRAVLGVADSRPIANFAKKQGWKLGVDRFVAGEDLESALSVLRALEAKGMRGILDLLGEFVASEAGAEAMTREILDTLTRLEAESISRYMSVKPTQLGLSLSYDLALSNATRVAQRAQEAEAHVCLDMENYPCLPGTLGLYRDLHARGFGHVSTVLQSYLRRSLADLQSLLELSPRPTLRIVKGAYRESPEVAFQDKAKVDAQFREMVRLGLEAGAYLGVATHDERILEDVKAFARTAGLGPEAFEFQLLYGVKPRLQERLVAEGHTVRVYVPYGEDWYGYFSRRLAERPANLMFVLRGLFG